MILAFLLFTQKKMKTRIVYNAKTGYKPERGNNVFQDLVEFVELNLKAYEPLSGSDFSKIFGASTGDDRGLYGGMGGLISTAGSDELIQLTQNQKKNN